MLGQHRGCNLTPDSESASHALTLSPKALTLSPVVHKPQACECKMLASSPGWWPVGLDWALELLVVKQGPAETGADPGGGMGTSGSRALAGAGYLCSFTQLSVSRVLSTILCTLCFLVTGCKT